LHRTARETGKRGNNWTDHRQWYHKERSYHHRF